MIWPVSAESKGEKAVGASGHPFGEVSAHPSEVKAKVTQLCPTLCNATDYIVEYIVHGILQARILVWVVFPSSRGSSQPRDRTQVSRTAGGFFTS